MKKIAVIFSVCAVLIFTYGAFSSVFGQNEVPPEDLQNNSSKDDPGTRASSVTYSGNGDAFVNICADLNNYNESDNAYLYLAQDGYAVTSYLGLVGFSNNGPNGLTYTDTRSNATLLGTYNNYDLQFGTNRYVRMTIEKSGDIGIGTTTPTTKLHIEGGNDASNTSGGYITLGSTSSTNLAIDNNEIIARTGSGAGILHLQAGGGTVGIGCSGLEGDIAGVELAVDGEILCEEVMVKLSGDWADFVFDKKYDLKSLPQVEKYIKENHHLPDVPSASEVEENGIELGDMNKILLQKIEELTLYIIDQNKINDKQKDLIETLRKRIEDLEKCHYVK